MDRRRLLGIGLVLVSAAGFGSGTILAAPVYGTGVDWLTLLGWRFLLGATLAWAWVLSSADRRAAIRRLSRRQLAVAFGLGVLYTGNAGTYYAALESVPAALAGVLVYTYPVITAILSLRLATRLPGRRPWIALGLTAVGVVLALGGIEVSDAPPTGGIILVLLSSLIYSFWIVLSARLSGERRDRLGSDAPEGSPTAGNAAAATALMTSATALALWGGALALGRPLDPGLVPPAAWPGLVAIGFAASFIAIQTFYAGARRLGGAQAALLSTVEPLIIVVLAALVLDQRLGTIQLVGAVLIVVGVIVAQTAGHPRGAPQPALPLDSEL